MTVQKLPPSRMHAKTVYDCWKIASAEAHAYQRMMNKLAKKKHSQKFFVCRAARDAASRIALKIRYGGRRRHQ